MMDALFPCPHFQVGFYEFAFGRMRVVRPEVRIREVVVGTISPILRFFVPDQSQRMTGSNSVCKLDAGVIDRLNHEVNVREMTAVTIGHDPSATHEEVHVPPRRGGPFRVNDARRCVGVGFLEVDGDGAVLRVHDQSELQSSSGHPNLHVVPTQGDEPKGEVAHFFGVVEFPSCATRSTD